MSTSINVYHEPEGVIFRKIQADSGISYIAIPVEEIDEVSRDLLVRHGNPETGHCGYYPLGLLLVDSTTRRKVAACSRKRPPSETWVSRTKQLLQAEGLTLH